MNNQPIIDTEPVSVAQALAGVLMTGVALAALLIPGLDEAMQIAIIAFGNSLIVLGSVIWARARVVPTQKVRMLLEHAADTGETPSDL